PPSLEHAHPHERRKPPRQRPAPFTRPVPPPTTPTPTRTPRGSFPATGQKRKKPPPTPPNSPPPNSMPSSPAPRNPAASPPSRPGRLKNPPPGAPKFGLPGWVMVRLNGCAVFGAVDVLGGAENVRPPRDPELAPPPTRPPA